MLEPKSCRRLRFSGSLQAKARLYRPSLKDIEGLCGIGKNMAGWSLDDFVADW
jgi:hypothetical protein